jgi:hypothetical protein
MCALSSSASLPSPSLYLPRLRFFEVTGVVTSDFTTIFVVFFERILLVSSQSISTWSSLLFAA